MEEMKMEDRNYRDRRSYDQARQTDRYAEWDRGEHQNRNQGYVGRDGLQSMQDPEGVDARYQSNQEFGRRGEQSGRGDTEYERGGYMSEMGRQGGYQGGSSQGQRQGGFTSDWGDGRQQDGFRNDQTFQGGFSGGAWQGEGQRSGQSHRGSGPRNYQRSDDRIYEDVCDRLSDDHHVDASDIEVSVSDREVTLTGEVDSKQAKRHAEDCADSCSGVEHVQNNLRVRKSQSNAAKEDSSTANGM